MTTGTTSPLRALPLAVGPTCFSLKSRRAGSMVQRLPALRGSCGTLPRRCSTRTPRAERQCISQCTVVCLYVRACCSSHCTNVHTHAHTHARTHAHAHSRTHAFFHHRRAGGVHLPRCRKRGARKTQGGDDTALVADVPAIARDDELMLVMMGRGVLGERRRGGWPFSKTHAFCATCSFSCNIRINPQSPASQHLIEVPRHLSNSMDQHAGNNQGATPWSLSPIDAASVVRCSCLRSSQSICIGLEHSKITQAS